MSGQDPGAPPAWTAFFASLGPVGSLITSLVVAVASYLSGLLTGWLQQKGFIGANDVPVVTGIVLSATGAFAVIGYKALGARLGAKVTAVAAQPGVTVVVPPEVALSPEHAADPAVITPQAAGKVFGAGVAAEARRSPVI